MLSKPASTSQPIHELLANRWSPRAFDPDAAIDRTQMTALAEAARWAPSCFGAQPWGFIFCNRDTDRPGWERALECLVPGNQAWAKNCPLLIAAAAPHQIRAQRIGKCPPPLRHRRGGVFPYPPGRSARLARPPDGRLRYSPGQGEVRTSRRCGGDCDDRNRPPGGPGDAAGRRGARTGNRRPHPQGARCSVLCRQVGKRPLLLKYSRSG